MRGHEQARGPEEWHGWHRGVSAHSNSPRACSSGIASSGGAGKTLAEWIANGAPTRDVSSVDIRRFSPLHANAPFLRDRVKEVLGMHYRINYPRQELLSARPMRVSPLNADLTARGAVWGSKFGWDRPNYFGPYGEGIRGEPSSVNPILNALRAPEQTRVTPLGSPDGCRTCAQSTGPCER